VVATSFKPVSRITIHDEELQRLVQRLALMQSGHDCVLLTWASEKTLALIILNNDLICQVVKSAAIRTPGTQIDHTASQRRVSELRNDIISNSSHICSHKQRFEGICSARGHFNEVTSATQKGFSTDMTIAAYYPQVFLFTAGGHPLS